MTDEPTPRQVLYALVALGFVAVVGVLVIGAAAARVVPVWWTVVTGLMTVGALGYGGWRWRSTRMVLLVSLGLFVFWTVGTLIVR